MRAKLPMETQTEDRLFFVLFRELITEAGWYFYYIQSKSDSVLYFGADEDVEKIKQNGCVVLGCDGMFKTACKMVIKYSDILKK